MRKGILFTLGVILVVAAVVVGVAVLKNKRPVPSTFGVPPSTQSAGTTSTKTLGGQIYNNVAPQAAVPQSLPQVNPFE